MRSLARLLVDAGCLVSGSEANRAKAETLREIGTVYDGHSARHVDPRTRLVIHSVAIDASNPERRRAKELDIAQLPYPRAIGWLMDGRFGVAVAGTHGKSTTAAMTAEILARAGFDPSVMIGADGPRGTSGGRFGRGRIVLAEACEYRRSFLALRPEAAVLLGIEPDHFDYFASPGDLESAFAEFAARIAPAGLLLVPAGCRATLQAAKASSATVRTFAAEHAADWTAHDLRSAGGRYRFRISFRGRSFAEIRLRVPGRHNVFNAVASVAMSAELGATADVARAALADFPGLDRRLETVGLVAGRTLVDDYAHHPTAIRAGLTALRERFPGRRLWCVFQPHQASRTWHLLDELAESLKNADRVLVTDIFHAREPAVVTAVVSANMLAERINDCGGDASAVKALSSAAERLAQETAPGDVVVTMGAGNIREVCNDVIDRFRSDRAA